jgi:hypothetical protein
LNHPTATERSRAGNHSAIALMPEGTAAASASPSSPRNAASPSQPVADACSMLATDHAMPNSAKPERSPMWSTMKPAMGCMIV